MRSTGRNEKSRRSGQHVAAWIALTAFCVAPPGVPVARAAPAGEHVTHGEAAVEREGSLTRITTGTESTIIEWEGGFDIHRDEAVRIDQPCAECRTLNRDRLGDPTRIDGGLSSNGIVYVENLFGVYVGGEAVIDVGGLVAAAGNLSDADFLDGVDRFTDVSGEVAVAQGALVHARDSVVLVGRAIANHGTILADDGLIAFVVGEDVLLTRPDGRLVVRVEGAPTDPSDWAIRQAGTLDAGRGRVSLTTGDAVSLAMNHTGITRARDIELDGGDRSLVVVAAGAVLDASDATAGGVGGRVVVTGDKVALLDAELDASGDAGGGEILVGGAYRGGDGVRRASRTYVDAEAELRANALREGDGGRVIVWSDEKTGFYGSLAARGGERGGDGGFAEISGARVLDAHGRVDLSAAQGATGTLLYDPVDIEIAGGAAAVDGTDSPDTDPLRVAGDGDAAGQILFGDTGLLGAGDDGSVPFTIHESEIEGTDANIVLEAANSIAVSGDFVAGDVRIADGNSLTLRTRNGDGDAASSPPGIDLTDGGRLPDLEFRTSGGGDIEIETGSAAGETIADLRAGVLVAGEGLVALRTRNGGVQVGSIEAGAGTAEDGTTVVIETGTGDITLVDRIVTGRDIVASGVEGDPNAAIGGSIRITAGDAEAATGGGNVSVGEIEVEGGQFTTRVDVRTQQGDVVVGSITGNGVDAEFAPAEKPHGAGTGTVVDLASANGSVSVGSVQAAGGNATGGDPTTGDGGDGGLGGFVGITTVDGDASVGSVDVSGGMGVAVLDDDGETLRGTGGLGGAIAASATGTGIVHVQGGLTARGGAASGAVDIDGEPGVDVAPAGGRGGTVLLASETEVRVGEGVIGGVPLDFSGGDSDSGEGGNASFALSLPDGTLAPHAIRIVAEQDVHLNGSLRAVGGDALATPGVAGSDGGAGGSISIGSLRGSVLGASATITVSGGKGEGIGDFQTVEVGDDVLVLFNENGGEGGDVTLVAGSEVDAPPGSLEIGDIETRGGEGATGAGGAGGDVLLLSTAGTVALAGIDTSGGDARGTAVPRGDSRPDDQPALEQTTGADGGGAGDVFVATGDLVGEDGTVTLRGSIVARGGSSVPTDAPEVPGRDGTGGAVQISAARRENVGTPEAPEIVVSRADIDVDPAATAPGFAARTITLTGARIGPSGPVLLGGAGDDDASASVSAEGDVRLDVARALDADPLQRVTLTQTEVTANTDVGDGAGTVVLDVNGGASAQTIAALDTTTLETGLEYRLDEPPASDPAPFEIARLGAGTGARVGAAGVTLVNVRGAIEGSAAGVGAHIEALGDLTLEAGEGIGALGIGGSDGVALRATARGDVGIELASSDVLDAIDVTQRNAATGVAITTLGASSENVLITSIAADESGDGGSRIVEVDTTESEAAFVYRLAPVEDVAVEGATVDEAEFDVAIEAMRLGGSALVSSLGDVVLEGGASAPAIAANGNDVALVADADPDTGVDFAGGALRNADIGNHAIDMGATDPAAAPQLLLRAGSGVGTQESRLQVRDTVSLAGGSDAGGFYLESAGSSDPGSTGPVDVRVAQVEIADPTDLAGERPEDALRGSGISAGGGDVELANASGRIVLAELDAGPHVSSGGRQLLDAPVEIENARIVASDVLGDDGTVVGAELTPENAATLVAGGDVVFTSRIDASEESAASIVVPVTWEQNAADATVSIDSIPASLAVDAGGRTTFGADVGALRPLGRLETTAVTLTASETSFALGGEVPTDPGVNGIAIVDDVYGGRAGFGGAIDGASRMTVRARSEVEDVDSWVLFGGDIGASTPPVGLDVEVERVEPPPQPGEIPIPTPEIRFTGAERVVVGSGGIALNVNRQRPDAPDVPKVATIADTQGGLSFETSGSFETGASERISVTGPLGIRSEEEARFGDLAATEIAIEASRIEVIRRDDGPVLLPDGTSVADGGVDIVANDILLAPGELGPDGTPIFWDDPGTADDGLPLPTFVLGSGGISAPGSLAPFEVIRFNQDSGAVSAASFDGGGGVVLDLTGTGGPVVGDPVQEIPRPEPGVAPTLEARFSDAAPVGRPPLRAAEVVAFVRCVEIGGSPPEGRCTPEDAALLAGVQDFRNSALATERAEEIALRTRRLFQDRDAIARLRASFAVAGRGYRELAGFREVDGAELYYFVAENPPYHETRDQLDELAWLYAAVDLLGLSESDTRDIQRALGEAFAESAGMPGLDADALTRAVGASRFGPFWR
jgi:filamentous hemagglutinin family protein